MRGRLRAERGSVVAEFAVALPAVLVVLATLLAGVQVGAVHVRAQDAAADAARSWGRGDPASAVAAHVQRQVPGGRVVRTSRGDLVCAIVRVTAPGPMGRLGLIVSATACALSGGR